MTSISYELAAQKRAIIDYAAQSGNPNLEIAEQSQKCKGGALASAITFNDANGEPTMVMEIRVSAHQAWVSNFDHQDFGVAWDGVCKEFCGPIHCLGRPFNDGLAPNTHALPQASHQ